MTMHTFVERIWYGGSALRYLLLPFAWIYAVAVMVRAALYRAGILRTLHTAAPVIVVGNITAGGAGKTPIVIWLVNALIARGFKVAVVARGYGGSSRGSTVLVDADSDPGLVGDEPVLVARRTGAPVFVNADRYAAAARAVDEGADVVVSDDGLQHYRLGRAIELAVVDAGRGFGNGMRIPAGPLREPISRLAAVDRILLNQTGASHDVIANEMTPCVYRLRAAAAVRIADGSTKPLADFANETVHAIAGIGDPERFFVMLEGFGIVVHRHPLPDHATMTATDFTFQDELPVFMTEKDGVKCPRQANHCWTVPVDVEFNAADERALIEFILNKSGLPGE